VNWCEALGTVLANDEVVNGVSERGGHPVVKKTLRQWYLRITEYADRLLEGLNKVDFSDAMKEMQTNWIGKSEGAEIEFAVRLTPNPSPGGEGGATARFFQTVDKSYWGILKKYGRENRKNPTEAEDILWQRMRNNQTGVKVRRQHAIQGYIVDFALLEVNLAVEVDGEYHNEEEQRIYDEARTKFLKQYEIDVIRFSNEEVMNDTNNVIKKIINEVRRRKEGNVQSAEFPAPPSPPGEGWGEVVLKVYTTRSDTIFGVDFMVIAPEHELVEQITTVEQKQAVEEYITYVKSRSERERMAEKKITGVFTGGYATHPFDNRKIPVWISEYVLAGYGTGAIMAVPCGDERDHKFARHFNIPITNIIGSHYNGEEANPTKEAILENSGFLNGLLMKDAIDVAIKAIEEKNRHP
jgi:leucyl-tRNA synthetase